MKTAIANKTVLKKRYGRGMLRFKRLEAEKERRLLLEQQVAQSNGPVYNADNLQNWLSLLFIIEQLIFQTKI